MSFWKKKNNDFDKIQQLLEQNPGQSARQLAKAMRVAPSTIMRQLPSMEEAGYLISEDKNGRLWPFKRKN